MKMISFFTEEILLLLFCILAREFHLFSRENCFTCNKLTFNEFHCGALLGFIASLGIPGNG